MKTPPPSVLALVQARMGSTRLPGKALRLLNGQAIVDWVVQRVGYATLVDTLVVAVPDTGGDAPLAAHLQARGTAVFRGPENDVLARFVQAGAGAGAGPETLVIRICADNPFIWGGEIDALVRHFRQTPCDYAYNHIPRGNAYPDGLGAEILRYDLLCRLDKEAVLPAHREHCLSCIWDNASRFRISTFDPADPALHRPDVKLDIDTEADFIAMERLGATPDLPPAEILRLYDAAHYPDP